jgi:hypothetical protein
MTHPWPYLLGVGIGWVTAGGFVAAAFWLEKKVGRDARRRR